MGCPSEVRCYSTVAVPLLAHAEAHIDNGCLEAVESDRYSSEGSEAHFDRVAESFDDLREAIHLNEPKMTVRAVLELVEADPEEVKVLDFGAGQGHVGALLAEQGFSNIYGQEGSEQKSK